MVQSQTVSQVPAALVCVSLILRYILRESPEHSEGMSSLTLNFECGLSVSALAAVLQTVTQLLIFLLFIMNFSRDRPLADICGCMLFAKGILFC